MASLSGGTQPFPHDVIIREQRMCRVVNRSDGPMPSLLVACLFVAALAPGRAASALLGGGRRSASQEAKQEQKQHTRAEEATTERSISHSLDTFFASQLHAGDRSDQTQS